MPQQCSSCNYLIVIIVQTSVEQKLAVRPSSTILKLIQIVLFHFIQRPPVYSTLQHYDHTDSINQTYRSCSGLMKCVTSPVAAVPAVWRSESPGCWRQASSSPAVSSGPPVPSSSLPLHAAGRLSAHKHTHLHTEAREEC